MVQVSDAAIESNSPKSSHRSFAFINGGIALLFIVVSTIFIVLFITSSNEKNELESELNRLKGWSSEEENERNDHMSCMRMKECKRERSGTPPLLVISMDGFANRYINWKDTPTIKKMGECGGRAEFMYPSFPSKTFPNHYTMATGLYPGSHGIVDNYFFTPDGRQYKQDDGSFYGGEPIWNTVVKNGKVSKAFMWLGSYDKINGTEASFHNTVYNGSLTYLTRIDNIIEWLTSDDPPALTMLYLEEPDGSGHKFGPDSAEVRQTAILMDRLLNYVMKSLSEEGVLGCTNIILVSDHGMRAINKKITLDSISKEYAEVTSSAKNNVLFYGDISTEALQCNNGSDYRVYRSKEEVPLRLHYDHRNIGFPYILGNPGTMFFKNGEDLEKFNKTNNKGDHGWDNMDIEMQAIFCAVGPSIRQNITIAPFQNIQLYNLFADVMNIPPSPNNGTKGLLDELLVNPPERKNEFNEYKVSPCENVSFEDCNHKQQMSPSNTTGILQSKNASICSISAGQLFLLYSKILNTTIGMEVLVKKSGSYEGEVVTKLNGTIIGKKCEEGRGKSVLTKRVLESSLKLTWTDFSSSSLLEQAVEKLTKKKNTRLQIGFIFDSDGSIKSTFVTGFWCEGDSWRKEKDYCMNEKGIRTEAYVIPALAVENFNCLDNIALLHDYRTTLADIERLTSLSLLPKSMPLSMRRRISLFMSTQTFP